MRILQTWLMRNSEDLRARLTTELKTSMKVRRLFFKTVFTAHSLCCPQAKNTSTSTVLRVSGHACINRLLLTYICYAQSILSEVYSADKMTADGSKITDSAIRGIMQKGVVKRVRMQSSLNVSSTLTYLLHV
jgi:hypothetical protein